MNFSTADRIQSVIDNMQTAETLRAQQRSLLNGFFNGDTPWTAKEAEDNKILFNFNDKSGPSLLHKARGQYENAFLKPGNFFTVTVDAPPDKAVEYGEIITKRINQRMKDSRAYRHVMISKFAGVVLHGVGAQVWWDDQKWLPSSLGIQDILVPTDTELSMTNLRYFSVRRKMRPGELFKYTYGKGKNRRPGWNMKLTRKILDAFKDLNQNPHNYDWANQPEQMTELYKQNLTYYDSDSAPVIWIQDFMFREEGESENDKIKPGWHRRLLLDKDNTTIQLDEEDKSGFIYSPPTPFSPTLDQMIHFQFGDGNNVPPFMYHSIRSLAYLVYELLWTLNRLNCQFAQHVFEQLMTWLVVNDPSDRSRIDKISMQPPYAILPDGVRVVPATERYKIDPELVNLLHAQFRQNVSESTSTYTQQIDNGTQKERTKFEVEAILSQISALMSSMLNLAYNQEYYAYKEICRRFCIHRSSDFDVKHFQSDCVQDGVPMKYLNVERWKITPEQVLGAGNKMLELAQARELRAMRPDLPPTSQQKVDRIYITALTDDSKMAEALVPTAPVISSSIHDAQQSFGTLMQGVEVEPQEGVNHQEQIVTMLKMMGAVIQRIASTDGMGTPVDVLGLRTCAIYTAKHIGMLAQNPENKAMVKQFGDALGKMMNQIKAFSQRQAEQKNSQPQIDPETIAKIRGMMMLDTQKVKSKEMQNAQRLRHKEQGFIADQQRKNMEALTSTFQDSFASHSANGEQSIKAFQE